MNRPRPSQSTRPWAAWFQAAALGLALLAAPGAGASQEKLAASIRATRDEAGATRDQLQTTVSALDALVKQKEGSLKPAFDVFVAEVKRAQTNAALTTSRARNMQSEAQSHFGAWKKQIDGISNESLRKKGQKRLEAVQASYGKAAGQLTEAGNSFGPYLTDLADITKILTNDLTPGGVRSIRSTVSNAKFNLIAVRGHINDAIKELDRMQKSLTSAAGG